MIGYKQWAFHSREKIFTLPPQYFPTYNLHEYKIYFIFFYLLLLPTSNSSGNQDKPTKLNNKNYPAGLESLLSPDRCRVPIIYNEQLVGKNHHWLLIKVLYFQYKTFNIHQIQDLEALIISQSLYLNWLVPIFSTSLVSNVLFQ